MLKKRFGQNLLINKSILRNIVKTAEITKDDFVVEIGAGTGFLTEELALAAGKVAAFEIDRDFAPVLNDLKNKYPNLEIIMKDFLRYPVEDIIDGNKKIILVGNIPYNITTPIIMKVFKKAGASGRSPLQHFSRMVLMTQYEYAKRLCAAPSAADYGAITLFVNYYANISFVRKISRNNFTPRPKVDSALIKITPLPEPRHGCDEELLFKIIKSAFCQRRKKIINSLRSSEFFENIVGTGRDLSLLEAFEKAGIDPNLRAENLSLEDYARLTNNLTLSA